MNTSTTDDPQSEADREAIALTRKSLQSTRKRLRDSDALLKRAQAMGTAEPPHEDDVVRDE